MKSKSTLLAISLLFIGQSLFGQLSLDRLINNRNFNWLRDSSSAQLTIYYQPNSWTSERLEKVKERILTTLNSTKAFIGIQDYTPRIHVFIIESPEQMKMLTGRMGNGGALPEFNVITGIASDKINSIFSNHEFFHVMAMNLWGTPKLWINEGMAVYSDNNWQGHDLYELTKFLKDNNQYVSLDRLIRKFKSVDSNVSYPLMGSFMKYLDESYGRVVTLKIWQGKGNLKDLTGKSVSELEYDWLNKVKNFRL
jgi:hypothetical protein